MQQPGRTHRAGGRPRLPVPLVVVAEVPFPRVRAVTRISLEDERRLMALLPGHQLLVVHGGVPPAEGDFAVRAAVIGISVGNDGSRWMHFEGLQRCRLRELHMEELTATAVDEPFRVNPATPERLQQAAGMLESWLPVYSQWLRSVGLSTHPVTQIEHAADPSLKVMRLCDAALDGVSRTKALAAEDDLAALGMALTALQTHLDKPSRPAAHLQQRAIAAKSHDNPLAAADTPPPPPPGAGISAPQLPAEAGLGVTTGTVGPTLSRFGTDLTELARRGRYGQLVGRDHEVSAVLEVLCRRGKGNVALVGAAGVGKTAIVEGLASRIASDLAPARLRGSRIIGLEMNRLLAGTAARGDFEARWEAVIQEAEVPGIILFIDELHTLIGGGGAGQAGADQSLKAALARGQLRLIGATTEDEFHRYMERDQALMRRFEVVKVAAMTTAATLELIGTIVTDYETYHSVTVPPDSVRAIVELCERHLPTRNFPDKAIDVLDSACVRARVAAGDDDRVVAVTPDHVAQIVSQFSGVPLDAITSDEVNRLQRVEEVLARRVLGQPEAVARAAHVIRASRTGLRERRRPLGSLLFTGPPGVGKTELARAIADFMFGDDQALVVFAMSEFYDRIMASRLLGSPPGYIHSDEGGQLTEAVSRRPYAVVLFDEIEKAHPSVLDVLLSILDQGRATDARGKVVSFSNTIIVLTSNLVGNLQSPAPRQVGFVKSEAAADVVMSERAVREELRLHLRPELVDRIDAVAHFTGLDWTTLRGIVDHTLERLRARVSAQRVALEWDGAVLDAIADTSQRGASGARNVARVVDQQVAAPLAHILLTPEGNDTVHLTVQDGEIVLVPSSSVAG